MFRPLAILTAGLFGLACVGATSAADSVRADGGDTIRLDGKGDADLQETRGFHGGGGYHGGYHGGYGGYRGWGGYGGYRGGYGYGGYRGYGYGGYRGYGYGGFYRPYYGYGLGFGYYRPYYGGYYGGGYYGGGYGGYGGYYGAGYGGGYGGYYASPVYSYYSPCSTDVMVVPNTTVTMPVQATYQQQIGQPVQQAVPQPMPQAAPQPAPQAPPQPMAPAGFSYDGGPRYIVPMPRDTAPAAVPTRPSLPRDGRLVSNTPAKASYRYLAYGETPEAAPAPAPARVRSDLITASLSLGEGTNSFSGGTMVFTHARR